jgi:hypothetical protein
MHFLQSTVFVLLAVALGLVTATAEQNDANRPFACTSVHPVGYCSREIDNQHEEGKRVFLLIASCQEVDHMMPAEY